MQNKLLVVIVTYNNEDSIRKCLESIISQKFKAYYCLLIDNGSTDKTVILTKKMILAYKMQSRIGITANLSNIGFSKAVNIGFNKLIKDDYSSLLLLNPDTYFKSNLFACGLKVLNKSDRIGSCSPIILYPNSSIWWFGTKRYDIKDYLLGFNFGISKHINKGQQINLKSVSDIWETQALTGCAMFIKKNAIERVGKLDERFFMYAEDIDYSMRLVKNNFQIVGFSTSPVYHSVNEIKSISKFKKYQIYLTSSAKYIIKYYSIIILFIWIFKLPFIFLYKVIFGLNKS